MIGGRQQKLAMTAQFIRGHFRRDFFKKGQKRHPTLGSGVVVGAGAKF